MAVDRVWDELIPDNTTKQVSPKDIRDSLDEVADEVDVITIQVIRADAIDDAGDGSVAGDINATDFSGRADPDPAPNTYIHVKTGTLVQVAHKGVAYAYFGPSGVNIGLGGNYVTLASQWATTGITLHEEAGGRDSADQHPQSAITDLEADQTTQDNRLGDLEAWDADHVDPIGNADPHPQYLLPEELPSTAVSYFSVIANGADYSLINTPPTGAENSISGTVDDADVLVATFIHQTPLQQDILYAELQSNVVMDLDGEAGSTFVYPVVYLNYQAGGRIELGRGTPQILQATRATYQFAVQILGPITATAGDWTSVELYGSKDGGGASRTVTIFVDGGGTSRNITYLPIPAYPAEHGTTHNNDGADPIPDLQQVSENFVFAAYVAFKGPTNTAFPDLGATWQPLDFLTLEQVTPRNIINEGNSQFSFTYEGVYLLTLSGSIEHNDSTSGRTTSVRTYNYTGAEAGSGIVIGTGRNMEATTIFVQALFVIAAADIGDVYGIEIGGGDVYTAVNFQACGLGVHNIGEWRAP